MKIIINKEILNKDIDEIVKEFNVNIEKGLNDEEVQERLNIYGYNDVKEKKENNLKKFLKKFWNIVAWILEITAILSYFLGKYIEFYMIVFLLIFNAILSYYKEEKANKALELLKRKLQVESKVLRNGNWKIVPSRELVPGDIVKLKLGDFVPADIKIINGYIEVDQSMITGESLTISKKRNDVVYSGSIVKRGEAIGIVVLTGKNTYFGKTVELVSLARSRLRTENIIFNTSFILLGISLFAIIIVFIYLFLTNNNIVEFLPFSLILLLGAIPVAIPTMFTISLALGSTELSKKGVLVTRLNSIESAATMNILFTDKTGTITMNQISINKVFPLNGFNERDVILYGKLASREEDKDPIDLAFINKAKEINIDDNFKIIEFRPFDPSLRRTEADILINNKKITVSKGSVDVLSKLANVNPNDLYKIVEDELNTGNRILAVAIKEENWKIVGLVSMRDPPRNDSKELIEELRRLGIKVVMLTGDALPIAKQIAREVGIGDNVVRIKEIKDIENIDGIAEIYPEDKYNIVKLAQDRGYVCGMTGDGVNDSPALKQADVGIAVSNATDIAKSSAGVVLTEPGLKNIVDLIIIGRSIVEKIKVWIRNRVTRSLFEISFISLGFIIFGKYIISFFNIALLIFLYDFVTISISTDNIRGSKLPEKWNIKEQFYFSAIISIFLTIEGLLLYYFFLNNLSLEISQTLAFDFIIFSNLFNLLNVREKRNFWESKPSNPLLFSIILDIIFVIIISYFGFLEMHSAPISYIIFVLLYSILTSLIINNFIKIGIEKFINL